MRESAHLEGQAGLDLVGEHIGNGLVEVGQDAHGQLRLDTALGDQRVERVRESTADAVFVSPRRSSSSGRGTHLLLRYSS